MARLEDLVEVQIARLGCGDVLKAIELCYVISRWYDRDGNRLLRFSAAVFGLAVAVEKEGFERIELKILGSLRESWGLRSTRTLFKH